MTAPEDALRRASEAAGRARSQGQYREGPITFEVDSARLHDERLYEWAIIKPDRTQVYSTRKWGMPITWLKRGLLRALRQYHGQITAQQSRFNSHVVAHLMSLDDRVRSLERLAGHRESSADPRRPPGSGE